VRPELFPDKWFLHHENTFTHSTSHQGVSGKKIHHDSGTHHYSPDLTLCSFFLFPTMKNHFKRSYFENMEEIQKVMMTFLNKLQVNDFWKCFNS
jgi:hypothetical protein